MDIVPLKSLAVRCRIRFSLLLLVFSIAGGCSRKSGADTAVSLEKKFAETMSGSALIGHSTSTNKEGMSGEERYYLDKVSKLVGDEWLFQTRMRLGSHDFPLPVPVTIRWAGDTPVVTLTDLYLPGLGTYTARVVLYRDQYAGTWSGKHGGGQLFGKIVRQR